jgi:hypothetical protein
MIRLSLVIVTLLSSTSLVYGFAEDYDFNKEQNKIEVYLEDAKSSCDFMAFTADILKKKYKYMKDCLNSNSKNTWSVCEDKYSNSKD